MGFTTINEGFTCEACGLSVPPAQSTCRNHCPACLVSKHVDDAIPGDRASSCNALMNAMHCEGTDPDKLDIMHECTACGKAQRNKAAHDDNRDKLFALLS